MRHDKVFQTPYIYSKTWIINCLKECNSMLLTGLSSNADCATIYIQSCTIYFIS
jgi:hypothetical protein